MSDFDADCVVKIVGALEAARIDVWLDGGWGVDALLGEQTRSHGDLDVIVRASDVSRIRELLAKESFAPKPGGSATNFVLADPSGRELDVHAIEFDSRGFGAFALPGGGRWPFPPSAFQGRGRVTGREVRCLSPEAQVQCHGQGYAPTEKDLRDMERLQERFGVVLPLVLCREEKPPSHDDTELVLRLDRAWNDAYVRNERSALADILADDFRGTLPDGRTIGKSQLLQPTEPRPVWFRELSLEVYGPAAVSRGRIRVQHPEGAAEQRFVRVYARREGRWQAVSVHVFPLAPETLEEKIQRVLRDDVAITPYDPAWPESFAREKAHLLACLPDDLIRRVEHFGSTAVPGLSAKPIVDLLVEVTDLGAAKTRIAPVLEAQGYDYFWRATHGDSGPPFYAWFIKRDPCSGARTHHVHMVEREFETHWDRLHFRDHLRAHPDVAREYERLKRELAAGASHDRVGYTAGKTAFVVEVTERAKRERGTR